MRDRGELISLVIMILGILGLTFIFNIVVSDIEAEKRAEIDQLEEKVQELKEEAIDSQKLIKEIKTLRERNEDLHEKVEKWLKDWEITSAEITSYAPLCEDAIAGWDYSGDPSITASGGKVVPGRTAAAPADVPFGSIVYVDGHGFYEVNDRGGLVNYNSQGEPQFDLAVGSKAEAQAVGRQSVVVAIKEGGGLSESASK